MDNSYWSNVFQLQIRILIHYFNISIQLTLPIYSVTIDFLEKFKHFLYAFILSCKIWDGNDFPHYMQKSSFSAEGICFIKKRTSLFSPWNGNSNNLQRHSNNPRLKFQLCNPWRLWTLVFFSMMKRHVFLKLFIQLLSSKFLSVAPNKPVDENVWRLLSFLHSIFLYEIKYKMFT